MNVTTPKEYADYEWAVNLNRVCLRLIGVWPDEDRGTRKLLKRLYVTVILLLMTMVCLIPCLCSVIFKCEDMMAVIDNLGYFIPFVISVMKFITIYKKKEVLLPVINMIAEDWAKTKTDAEKDVMIGRARVSRLFSGFFYACTFLLLLWLLVVPRFGFSTRYLTNETDVRKSFPLPTYYLCDVSQSPYFEIVLAAQGGVLAITIFCYTGVDNFFGMVVLHICGQLENLRTRLAAIKESERFDRVLAATVNDHTRLIRATDAIEDTFTLLLLLVFVYFVIFLCVNGLLVINIILEGGDIPLSWLLCMLCTVANTVLQTSLYCAAGQILLIIYESCTTHQVRRCVRRCLRMRMAKSKAERSKGLDYDYGEGQKAALRNCRKIISNDDADILQRTIHFHGAVVSLSSIVMFNLIPFQILKVSFSYISFLMTKL